MRRRRLTRPGMMALALALVAYPHIARAGCLETTLAQDISHPGIVAIFRASVASVRTLAVSLPGWSGPVPAQIATVDLKEIWKGDVPRTALLYFVDIEGQRLLELGNEYLFLASKLTDADRQQFGVSAGTDQRLRANEYGCGAIPIVSAFAQRKLLGAMGGLSRFPK